jgi:radical SAM protein with 4Fe4S-binding SPASM domain
MRNSVFLVPVGEHWLLYAPLLKTAALLNPAAAERLRRGQVGTAGALGELASQLRTSQAEEPRPPEGMISPSFLGIIPTRGCNIDCVYCNFGPSSAGMATMPPEVAVAAVDWMANRLEELGRTDFRVQFFGGEPFVAPEIVDIVVHRVRYQSLVRGLVPRIEASTNGVFNDARCQFIGDYFDTVVLSMDGPPIFQDRNRPTAGGGPTSERVQRTATELRDMPTRLVIRVCVTQESVAHLEAITQWLIDSFRPSMVDFEPMTPCEPGRPIDLVTPDPFEFGRHFLGAYRLAESQGVEAVYSAAVMERNRLSCCPLGTDALIVSPDGRGSACYLLADDWRTRGLDLDVGRVHEDGSVEIDDKALARVRALTMEKPRCDGCLCRWSCCGGCRVNETYPGCPEGYTDFCVQTRLITACLVLRDLGCEDMIDGLLNDRTAMERLAHESYDISECLDADLPAELAMTAGETRPNPFAATSEG